MSNNKQYRRFIKKLMKKHKSKFKRSNLIDSKKIRNN